MPYADLDVRRAYQAAWRRAKRANDSEFRLRDNKKRMQWSLDNPERTRVSKAEYKRHRYHNDPEYKARHLAGSRTSKLRRQYGITPQQYESMLAVQDGRCALCHALPHRHRLCVDHDHRTGRVRGLLCDTCNRLLGAVESRMGSLIGLSLYLGRTKALGL